MSRPDLFPKPPRKAPRVLMHVYDAGYGHGGLWAAMACKACGHKAEYICDTVTEAKRGIPCPNCNKGPPQ